MAKSSNKSRDLDTEAPKPDPTDVKPGTIDDPKAYEEAKAVGIVTELPKKAEPPAPAEPLVTVEHAFRAKKRDPVALAFVRSQYLRGRTRKQTKTQWLQEFESFKTQKR